MKKRHELSVLRPLPSRYLSSRWRRLGPSVKSCQHDPYRLYLVRGWRRPLYPRLDDALSSAHRFKREVETTYDLCFAEGPWAGTVAQQLQKERIVRFFVYEDLDYFEGFIQNSLLNLKRLEMRRLEEISLTHADLVVCVGHELMRLRQSQTKKPIIVVSNGVDYPLFSSVLSVRNQEKAEERWEMVYTGSIEEWAGLQLIIAALPQLIPRIPEIHLSIVGNGRYLSKLQQEVEAVGLTERVTFWGKQSYQELPRYLKNASIGMATFVPDPLTHYAFPLKILEYMACGLPVIATQIGETAAILEQSKGGIAVPYDETALAKCVMILYTNPSLAQELGKNGRDFARDYDWDCLFEKELSIIEERLYKQE